MKEATGEFAERMCLDTFSAIFFSLIHECVKSFTVKLGPPSDWRVIGSKPKQKQKSPELISS